MSKDYLKAYGKPVRSLQQGGVAPAAPAPQAAPQAAPADNSNLEGMLAEYAQTRDPQLAVAIADSLVEMVAQQSGGQQAPASSEMPMAKRGGKAKAMIFKKKSKQC